MAAQKILGGKCGCATCVAGLRMSAEQATWGYRFARNVMLKGNMTKGGRQPQKGRSAIIDTSGKRRQLPPSRSKRRSR